MNPLESYSRLIDTISPTLEEMMKKPVPRNLDLIYCVHMPEKSLARYDSDKNAILISAKLNENTDRMRTFAIAHELVHSAQRDHIMDANMSLDILKNQGFSPIELGLVEFYHTVLFEGDANNVASKYISRSIKPTDEPLYLACMTLPQFVRARFIHKQPFPDVVIPYLVGETVISSLEAEKGRSGVNSLYTLPLPAFIETMGALMSKHFSKHTEYMDTLFWKALIDFDRLSKTSPKHKMLLEKYRKEI